VVLADVEPFVKALDFDARLLRVDGRDRARDEFKLFGHGDPPREEVAAMAILTSVQALCAQVLAWAVNGGQPQ
jgi:hypothetical protein